MADIGQLRRRSEGCKVLISAGYNRISYIAGWEGASTQRDREAGFMDILNASEIDLFSRECGEFKMEEASRATLEMFSKAKDLGQVVFVANDHMALALWIH